MHQHSEKELIDQFDVHRLLKFHLFYKPGLQFSISDAVAKNTGNMLSLSKIDLPIFRKKGQPEKVHIAPIPQTETVHFLLLNWQEKGGYELESSNSPCTYPEINDSFGFLGEKIFTSK